MQDPWSVVTMVLLAVLVGAVLPVLFQLFATLGAIKRLIERLGPHLDGTLAEVHETSRTLNRATKGIDESVQRARSVLDAAGDLGATIQQLNRMLRTVLVIGPALGVAIKTLISRYRTHADGEADEDSSRGESAHSSDTTEDETHEAQLRHG